MSDERRTETLAGTSSDVVPATLPPGHLVAGRWEIVRAAGSGGFAVVYEALDRRLDQRVALKILRSDRLGARSLRRLEREVALARRIESPHVVRVFDLGETEGGPFLTMELVPGTSLRQHLRNGALPVDEALALAGGILQGLRALHALGIVHRDIKPGNILITPDGTPKIADFGLAREWESADATTAGDGFAGTVEYISPEQALGKELRPASDLYSFGVLFYEMLTGALPFEGSSLAAVVGHLRETPKPVRALRPEVPRWLAQIVERLLAKRPEDRYADAGEVVAALRRRRWRPSGRGARRMLLPLVILVAAVAALVGFQRWSEPRFARLDSEIPETLRALGTNGELLWSLSIPGVHGTASTVLRDGDGESRVVTVRRTGRGSRTFRVDVRDAERGTLVRTVPLVDGSIHFRDFDPAFAVGAVQPIDVDGDGAEEVIVSFVHDFYPSWTAWVDPSTGSSRPVLLASGHHLPAGTADLNGDGHPELILAGTANRQGWYGGIAAIDMREALAAPAAFPVSTPDEARSRSPGYAPLLWYALVPYRFAGPVLARFEVDGEGVTIRAAGGEVLQLDRDGFPGGSRSRLGREERRSARARAYALLRAADRAAGARSMGEALSQARRAEEEAADAGDAILEEWCGRKMAMFLVAAGDRAGAAAAFERLFAGSPAAPDIAFDAANAFHLAGMLAEAVRWYERGLADDADEGRLKWEYQQGLVLALGELERWDRALEWVGAWKRSGVQGGADQQGLESYVKWRTGRPVVTDPAPGEMELFRYVRLESRAALGQPLPQLMAEAEREIAGGGESAPLFGMLLADLLDRAERREEAAAHATRWFEEARRRRDHDVTYRALYELMAERHARILP